MEPRGQEREIGIPNLHLAPLFPSHPPHKSRNSTLPSQTLDPPPLPDPKNHSPPPSADGGVTTDSVRYKECQKNHAVSMGGHAVDGCGEFMPSADDALRCAACDCHRNFHRKAVDDQTPPPSHSYNYNNPNRQSHLHQHQHQHGYPHTGVTMVSFGGNSSGGAAAESSSEDLNVFQHRAAAPPSLKKRFRTKFSRDQKDRMHEFARKLGWKMQNQDEQQVQDFCRQVGIKREVFKVWMHNNKQAIKKASSSEI